MAGKAGRGSRGELGETSGVGGQALPAATSGQARKSRTPSRKREGIKEGREGPKHSNPFMPGLRVRSDGWTAARTRVFLAVLGQTGCVTDAARIAGVSTTSVARSRRLFAPFDTACAKALATALRGLEAVAYERAVTGREMVIIRDGKEVERRIMPSDSILRMLIQRGDLAGALGRAMTAEEAEAFVLPEAVRHRFISVEEFADGIVFEDGKKQKRHIATQEETDAVLVKRIEMVEQYRRNQRRLHPPCDACGQAMPLTEEELDALDREEAAAATAPARDTVKRLPPPEA